METKRVIELVDGEINRHLALAQATTDRKLYASHMEVAEALILAKHYTGEALANEKK